MLQTGTVVQVALKVLSEELAADESFRRRFIRESKAAAAVDDPYLIPIYEAGEASGVLFIAMRYVPGGDARSLLRREGPLSAERVAAIISPVASALDAAHAAGLVHRDVKPANILLDSRQGRPDHPYLADFGISRRTQSLARLTGTGQFLGTVDYAAPEQIQGSSADGRADQYALACTVFELLSGEVPFRRDDPSAVIWSKMTEPPPLLTSRRADLPAAVNRVLAKALAKTPQDRYATCEEFSDALRKALGLNSSMPTIPQVGQPQTPSEHPADVTGAGQLAAAHDEQDQSTRDASGLPIPNPVEDRRQHRRPHYHSPDRSTSSNSPVPVSVVKARRAGIAMPESADIEPNLSRREEMPISGAAVSGTPWAAAVVTGAVVTSGDVGLHTIGSSMNLSATSGSVALGAVAFFVVAAVGSLWRSRPNRVT